MNGYIINCYDKTTELLSAQIMIPEIYGTVLNRILVENANEDFAGEYPIDYLIKELPGGLKPNFDRYSYFLERMVE